MAIRNIIMDTDPALVAKCHHVDNFNQRLHQLLDDMYETMKHADGVGLAAPQVGIRRTLAVVDVGDGLVEMINPKIVFKEGDQECVEGCLSSPGQYGIVHRPKHVIVEAQDRNGKNIKIDAKDFFANACCHEIDHLNGILFKTIAERMLTEDELEDIKRK